ncbi:hypothetical protein RFI_15669 [Reticulomyxa filosa]|uniref:Uncharacterized protein n=1 Tax=Reticulomyxa filosa TaxID=46433 RepID=X6N684_RETFI|nr:hypothetical protein RFI_15669 [Reticulomyxa filosa]|eukprot:ETO21536.1 hypothetical protein RFI_15669 [Reticulomyxa filosa]
MDMFHYYEPSHEKEARFYNNHSAHTDSGLMTVVIVTDEPGLEVYDAKLKCWVAIESLTHQYLAETKLSLQNPLYHRRFATVFWSDSVEYLNNVASRSNVTLKPLLHRVSGCERERFSVVFKQRTAPLRTSCRYQEDYVLAKCQMLVDKHSKHAHTLVQPKSDVVTCKKISFFIAIFLVILLIAKYLFSNLSIF